MSVKSRPSSATEEVFLFAKQPGYYWTRKPSEVSDLLWWYATRTGSGVVFGQRFATWKTLYPKTTPDPFREMRQ